MADDFEDGFGNRARLVGRLDAMVASGRVTEAEATRLRAAENADDFDQAVIAIRSRHASARLQAAVGSGQMSQEEADANLARIRRGEHPKGLRAHLGRIAHRR